MTAVAPSSSNCVAYWKMEDTSDASGNGHTLTVSGATSGQTGIIDNCYYFDGVNDYADVGSTMGFTDGDVISISCWVYIYGFNNPGCIFGDYDRNAVKGVYLFTFSSGIAMVNINGGYHRISSDTLSLNTWYHVVGIANADGTVKLYINNVEQTNDESAGTLPTEPKYSTRHFVFGAQAWYGSIASQRFFKGRIEELTVFATTTLTADNVEYLYNSGSPGSAQQYPFSSGGGSPISKINGVSWNSISKINGVSKASIAKINGVSTT